MVFEITPETVDDVIHARGVIDSLKLSSDVIKVTHLPRSARTQVELFHTAGRNADYKRSLLDELPLHVSAESSFAFILRVLNSFELKQDVTRNIDYDLSLADKLRLESTAVTVTTYIRALAHTLTLTSSARQSIFLLRLLDILMIDDHTDVKVEYMRSVANGLDISGEATNSTDFTRTLESVLSVNHSTAVNSDFIRELASLLLLVDDAEPTHSLNVEDSVSVVLVRREEES